MNVFGITDLPYSNKETQEIDQSDPTVIKYRYMCMGILALVILPINCVKQLATIRYVSMIIMIVVLYTISVVHRLLGDHLADSRIRISQSPQSLLRDCYLGETIQHEMVQWLGHHDALV